MIRQVKQWLAAKNGEGLTAGAGLAVATGLIVLACAWVGDAPVVGVATSEAREVNPKCAALARVVAGRTHSILDSERYRATERQAYDVCAADSVAFRRIVRGY